ncbi:MAG: LysM peptidoglycan-binding domain-containing protein [Nitrosomonadales bacterium]|nr:LysM peptidoglycan-binding domain-containing protein [Nitrosomonadales bacterium]
MGKIISLICFLLPALAFAAEPKISENAPDQHIVVKGDTLWGIAAEFFNDPWKWPQIWGLNKDTIKDPHWIYPGDIVRFDHVSGTLQVSHAQGGQVVKLSPGIRTQDSDNQAIPSIPAGAIAPFLNQPLVIEKNELANSPILVGTLERRVVVGDGDIGYVKGLSEKQGTTWHIYRPGKVLIDPDTTQILGYEVTYLGNAEVEKFDDLSVVRIVKARQEIKVGDRLVAPGKEATNNYLPHAPAAPISAQVISLYDELAQAGQYAVITLNKGRLDGLENGHVLALYRKGDVLRHNGQLQCDEADQVCQQGREVTLPDLRYGLIFVFRTFDHVACALVMQTRMAVERLDRVQTP